MKIETIDTSLEAKAFAKKIELEPKTYFLQGKWGSGKTEYIDKVISFLPPNYKLIKLELWKPKNKDSLEKKYFF
ncbi:KAP family NTPase [Streptococcus zalophi]|uniref:KAP family NTPase n=1 Tax=Streptococcus zalophi TaxID=640031 RepID=UPI00215BDFDD|nr:KAP family NTPase [Streptococcus zalophi]MCR8967649.1 KAP family NTPase [Streptococcus zalophi]